MHTPAKILTLLFFTLTVFSGCEKDNIATPVEPDPVINPERINFQAPVVGQFNTYLVYSHECGQASPPDPWELKLAITNADESSIEFTESDNNGTPVVFTARRGTDVLLISAEDRQQSRLFFFYGSDSLRLEASPVVELAYRDCVFYTASGKFTGDFVAEMPVFELAGKTFKNQKVVSCVPTILDLDGYLFYDKHGLAASITTSTSEFGGSETIFTTAFLLKE